MTVAKDARLQIRVGPQQKQALERAAAATHQNLSGFVLQAAAQQAEAILAERSVISLSPAAASAFTEALSQPGQVNERLAAALERPRRFRWVD